VVAGLQKVYLLSACRVNQAVLLGDTSRRNIVTQVFKTFWFANALKRVSHHGFNQFEDAQGDPPVSFNPVAQVLSKFGMEYG